MGKRVRSVRGEIVDFDLLKIKAEIASSPKPLEVQVREDFIESRLRRRTRKIVKDVVKQVDNEKETKESSPSTKRTVTKKKVVTNNDTSN